MARSGFYRLKLSEEVGRPAPMRPISRRSLRNTAQESLQSPVRVPHSPARPVTPSSPNPKIFKRKPFTGVRRSV